MNSGIQSRDENTFLFFSSSLSARLFYIMAFQAYIIKGCAWSEAVRVQFLWKLGLCCILRLFFFFFCTAHTHFSKFKYRSVSWVISISLWCWFRWPWLHSALFLFYFLSLTRSHSLFHLAQEQLPLSLCLCLSVCLTHTSVKNSFPSARRFAVPPFFPYKSGKAESWLSWLLIKLCRTEGLVERSGKWDHWTDGRMNEQRNGAITFICKERKEVKGVLCWNLERRRTEIGHQYLVLQLGGLGAV